jgi:hypothetical protein
VDIKYENKPEENGNNLVIPNKFDLANKKEKFIEDKNENLNKLLNVEKYKKTPSHNKSVSIGKEFRMELFNIMNSSQT